MRLSTEPRDRSIWAGQVLRSCLEQLWEDQAHSEPYDSFLDENSQGLGLPLQGSGQDQEEKPRGGPMVPLRISPWNFHVSWSASPYPHMHLWLQRSSPDAWRPQRGKVEMLEDGGSTTDRPHGHLLQLGPKTHGSLKASLSCLPTSGKDVPQSQACLCIW